MKEMSAKNESTARGLQQKIRQLEDKISEMEVTELSFENHRANNKTLERS